MLRVALFSQLSFRLGAFSGCLFSQENRATTACLAALSCSALREKSSGKSSRLKRKSIRPISKGSSQAKRSPRSSEEEKKMSLSDIFSILRRSSHEKHLGLDKDEVRILSKARLVFGRLRRSGSALARGDNLVLNAIPGTFSGLSLDKQNTLAGLEKKHISDKDRQRFAALWRVSGELLKPSRSAKDLRKKFASPSLPTSSTNRSLAITKGTEVREIQVIELIKRTLVRMHKGESHLFKQSISEWKSLFGWSDKTLTLEKDITLLNVDEGQILEHVERLRNDGLTIPRLVEAAYALNPSVADLCWFRTAISKIESFDFSLEKKDPKQFFKEMGSFSDLCGLIKNDPLTRDFPLAVWICKAQSFASKLELLHQISSEKVRTAMISQMLQNNTFSAAEASALIGFESSRPNRENFLLDQVAKEKRNFSAAKRHILEISDPKNKDKAIEILLRNAHLMKNVEKTDIEYLGFLATDHKLKKLIDGYLEKIVKNIS